MTRKDLGAWLMALAVLLGALALPAAANEGGQGTTDGEHTAGGSQPPGEQRPPAPPSVPNQGQLGDAEQGGTQGRDRVLDGSQTGRTDGSVGARDREALRDPRGGGDAVDTARADAGRAGPPEPPAPPEQPGDVAEKPGFGDNLKKIAKTVGTVIGPIGAIGGLTFFLLGIATFNPMFMLGGILAGFAGVMLGGLAQSYL